MREIIQEIVDRIRSGEPAALASIVSARGSLPMSRRSRMLILPDGAQRGTVGGGCLEAEVHAMGTLAMRSGEARLARFTLTEKQAGAEGLNCGGTVEMLIEPLGDPSRRFAPVYGEAMAALERGEETAMVTVVRIGVGGDMCRVLGKGLVAWKGLTTSAEAMGSDAALTAFAVEETLAVLGQDRAIFVVTPDDLAGEGVRLFIETINAAPSLYLFGGGHVSLSVARIARMSGFRVVVVDDRPAYSNPERFPEADRTLVLPMKDAVSQLPIDENSYIVAVTRGHQHDEPIIEQAIGTPAAYIGMIGSKRKVAIMWQRLKSRGASDADLARVHAPIGLPIGADTPAEIAVSIVAQLIEFRRRRDP